VVAPRQRRSPMSRWIHVLAAVILVGAAMPGGAGAWQWALERAINIEA